jgi:nucleolar GTP-binding protein
LSQFKRIPHIPTSDKLADTVFSQLKKIRVNLPRKLKKKRSDYSFYKTLYFRQFRFLFPDLEGRLEEIVSSFPLIQDLHPFHRDLIEVLYGIEKLKTSLSRINNTKKSLKSIEREVSRKLGQCEDADEAKNVRKEAIGRIGSTIKKLKEPLDDLITAKIQLSKVPDFNLFEKTIAFAGAPNAGKSSFVKLISTGNPEIAAYPFTTKELVYGHRKREFDSIQLLDTPGLLDRPLHARNEIEMRSILALKHLTDYIVFLYDPTEESPLKMNQQLNLFNEIKATFPEIPIQAFINKKDILSDAQLQNAENIVGKLERIATIKKNVDQLEKIILTVIEEIPEKKLFVKEEKKLIEDEIHKSKSSDKIEWIFFDEDDKN